MKAAICVTLLLAVALCNGSMLEFNEFKKEHGKTYASSKDHQYRYSVFKSNLAKIERHNADSSNTWYMKVNQFADMTEEEFVASFSGYKRLPMSGNSFSEATRVYKTLPESVDWRDAGVVTEPKNQGSCGSCWAFATIEQIESYAALANVTIDPLSAQEITSCSPNSLHCGGRGGCHGSIPQLGYAYVQLFGLTTAKRYPYWSGFTMITGRCKYDIDNRTPVVGITGYNTIPANDLEATLNHIANVGPLAIAADASKWQFYGGGVFSGCKYENNISLNHAIQLVGYGSDASHGDYWIVRNSWGKSWGEHGYIRLKRESELTCGLNKTPMDGTACENGPGTDEQEVCGMCGILYDSSYPLGAFAWPQ